MNNKHQFIFGLVMVGLMFMTVQVKAQQQTQPAPSPCPMQRNNTRPSTTQPR